MRVALSRHLKSRRYLQQIIDPPEPSGPPGFTAPPSIMRIRRVQAPERDGDLFCVTFGIPSKTEEMCEGTTRKQRRLERKKKEASAVPQFPVFNAGVDVL